MKYRIVEKADLSGEICFFPQYKKIFFWFNFMEMEVFPKVVKFYSLESATKFIKKQLKNPEKKIYYVGDD
jgi:hypothetical protein